MANVKDVNIRGWFKDPMERSKERDDFQMLIGSLNMPHYGLNFEWTGREAKSVEKNKHGGVDFSYQYVISGAEAISFDALKFMVETLRKVGTVDTATARDMENGGDWTKVA